MAYPSKFRLAIILVVAIVAVAFPAATVSAGTDAWTFYGMSGETITTVVTVTNHQPVWVGTEHGVWTNMGGTWSQLSISDSNTLVIAQYGSHHMFSGGTNGVIRSTDGGNTWYDKNTGLTETNVLALAMDPLTPTTLFAATSLGGVFKTTDEGDHWSAVNTGLTPSRVNCLAIDPFNPSIIYAGAGGGVYKTVNGGGSWELDSSDLSGENVLTLAVDPVNSYNIYAGVDITGVYKSENGGRTWFESTNGMWYENIYTILVDPVTPTTVYAGGEHHIYKSRNGGDLWTELHSENLSIRFKSLAFDPISEAHIYAGTPSGVYDLEQTPDPFGKSSPADGANLSSIPTLSWGISSGADDYEYCYDTSNNGICDTGWVSTGSDRSATPTIWSINTPTYWQVRANNDNGTEYANGGNWWRYTVRYQTFADVPINHPLWQYIEAFYNAGITTGCGTSPLIFCPENTVTRATMAVFLLRAKHGSGYTPPAASHYFADLPVAGKEWMEPWVDQLYREGITTGCATGPLRYCPENAVTRSAMAVFILRAKHGSSYTPPAASHYFADMPVAGKEWMEPWVDQLYREGITTGCGTGPLIFCPETAVKRQAMAAFIVRAFSLPLP